MIEQNIPLIIPLPKRKEIIANIESLFADARAQKFGEDLGWVSSYSAQDGALKLRVLTNEIPRAYQIRELSTDIIFETHEQLELDGVF